MACTFLKLYIGHFRGVLWNIWSLEITFGTVQQKTKKVKRKNICTKLFFSFFWWPLFSEQCMYSTVIIRKRRDLNPAHLYFIFQTKWTYFMYQQNLLLQFFTSWSYIIDRIYFFLNSLLSFIFAIKFLG